MTGPFEFIRGRLLPALLTAGGVTLLAAGLLTYTVPVAAEPAPTPSPIPTVAVVTPSPSPQITLPPIGSATPAPATPTPDPDRVATRIRIASLGIDLPIIKGPSGYPPCDVVMYLSALAQPGQGRATYLFAHARPGMFEPLLRTKAAGLRNLVVEVWTSDDQLFRYEIAYVLRDQTNLDDATSATTEQLWMQTSQGPNSSFGYTQVVATPLDVSSADPADAHPAPKPRAC